MRILARARQKKNRIFQDKRMTTVIFYGRKKENHSATPEYMMYAIRFILFLIQAFVRFKHLDSAEL